MSSLSAADWSKQNDAYLAAALEWLQCRLIRLGAANPVPIPPAPPPAAVQSEPERHWWFSRSTPGKTAAEPKALPPASGEGLEQSISEAASRMEAAAAADVPPALVVLTNRLGLSQFERNVLLLCVAMELHTGIGGLCSQAQGDAARRSPTFALALALFDEPAWDSLSPDRPLRYWKLIEINQPGVQPLTASALRADERIVNYVKGLNYLDDRLAPLVTKLAESVDQLPASQEVIAGAIADRVLSPQAIPPVIHLLGPESSSKQWIARRVGQMLNMSVLRLSADLLPVGAAEADHMARLWQRECLLLPVALYLDARDAEKEWPAVNRFLARSGGLMFLDTREAVAGLDRESAAFDVAKPSHGEQYDAWRQILGQGREPLARSLAGQFNLSVAEIRRIVSMSASGGGTPASDSMLWNACLLASRPRLDSMAQRIDAKATWEELVLADTERKLLEQIAAQVRARLQVYGDWGFGRKMNRGLGLTALFSGESGTGKTMAAEVIANELRLNLYRIDLSAVVSKYIGETEKNLRRVFDAAEDGGAILFFDEADALFGKRSEVKDSHDRYANIEVNYLLQRMEAYSGLAILATNMKSALDPAFVRRVRFIVSFAFPGPAERKAIWEKAFPAETPKEELDYDRLARFNLTGANIHSIALNAAFLAADAGTTVSMPFVLEAARTEFRKLEKAVNDAEFKWTGLKGAAA